MSIIEGIFCDIRNFHILENYIEGANIFFVKLRADGVFKNQFINIRDSKSNFNFIFLYITYVTLYKQ